MKLEGKTAIISGACGGIGRAVAERFANEGATVVVTDRNRDRASKVAADIGHGAYAVALDVTSEPSIAALIDEVTARSRSIDILVNNAAVFDMAPILDVTRASYDLLFDVNVKGLFFTLQAVASNMVKRGAGGKIINISSQAGRRGEALVSMYCATKAAVISLTQSAGLDLIKHRINVNGIAPGVVDTPMWDRVDALFARHENRPIGEKKAPRRRSSSIRSYGRAQGPDRRCGVPSFIRR